MKPIFFASTRDIPRGVRRVDAVRESEEELFIVRHPIFRKQPFRDLPEWRLFQKEIRDRSQWVYLPWAGGMTAGRGVAVHLLDEELFFELRTARNKNLIIADEQKKYRAAKVGVAGLSVGSLIISSLVVTGGPQVLKIADFDTLAPSNMNRIRASVTDLGVSKIELAARDVYGTDPFAKLYLWDKGVTESDIATFLTGGSRAGGPRLDIFIDAMDSLE